MTSNAIPYCTNTYLVIQFNFHFWYLSEITEGVSYLTWPRKVPCRKGAFIYYPYVALVFSSVCWSAVDDNQVTRSRFFPVRSAPTSLQFLTFTPPIYLGHQGVDNRASPYSLSFLSHAAYCDVVASWHDVTRNAWFYFNRGVKRSTWWVDKSVRDANNCSYYTPTSSSYSLLLGNYDYRDNQYWLKS